MEEINDLIDDFIDLFALRNNKKILSFILYGSYVEKQNNKLSDVDILLVISGNTNYQVSKMFEGLHLDIHALTVGEIENHIVYERANGNEYITSVLNRGKVSINRDNTIEYLKSLLPIKLKRMKRAINPACANLAISYAEDFLELRSNDDYKYYVALESLRGVIHVKLNASTIPELKVYKLYSNEEIAKNQYLVKLPNLEFRNLYLKAISEKNFLARKKILSQMLSYLIGTNIKDYAYIQDDVIDDNRMKRILISLNHLVITAEDNIIRATPYADALYFLTLNRIMNVIKKDGGEILDSTMSIFDEALKQEEENERIKFIESLFHIASSKYNIDYDDFVLSI